ncbi:uncharacterized protein P884DRAFT_276938 [Thermothelomyces heterothallicus CBS 202.75]|uniref:uncharacterized protein n=1 Tax=Thermothelomyces heterothallicus CBS 202.75 TaxID=1149848 RepID=UPI0037438522
MGLANTLLARHEAYMASAERDRLELTARIEQLERENAELEAKNKSITEENKSLREEVEQVNDMVKDAETKIGLLEATLLDSQREVRRLENATDRAATLERQIALLEEEQVVLRTTISRTQEEARTAMYRWRQAEKGLSDLQEQLERMEKEAREERERHVQVINRMERQRAMERELNTAAGRLKGAAAAKSMTDGRNSGKVVSHFVRDLLQDNANLQLGIAELREMLINANDEIQMLREQLMYHQPAGSGEPGSPKTLQAELAMKEPPTPPQPQRVSQELHVHHHFHVTHKPEARKPRKRRAGLTPGVLTPPQLSAPGSPIAARFQRGSLAGPLLSSGPNDPPPTSSTARWSLQSQNQPEFAPSSAPSSPRSTIRDSVFDGVGDLQSPTSPTTSLDPTSPTWKNAHRKKISELSLRSISETAMFPTDSAHAPRGHASRPRALTRYSIMSSHSNASTNSPYTTDDVPTVTSPPLSGYKDYDGVTDAGVQTAFSFASLQFDSTVEQRPRGLRHVVSHESIMSLSNGLDIHTLKARPSQLSLKPLGLTTAGTNLSDVTAQPTLTSGSAEGRRGSVILRDSIAQSLPPATPRRTGERVVSSPVRGRGDDRDSGRSSSRAPSALGRLVSWRPWKGGNYNTDATHSVVSPETSPSSTPVLAASAASTSAEPISALSLPANAAVAASSTASTQLSKSPQASLSSTITTMTTSTSSTTATKPTAANANANAAMAAMFRAPGVNQPGPVPGFQEFWAAQKRRAPPSKVLVDDQAGVQEALREVLEES